MTKLKLTGPAMFIALLVSWSALHHALIDHTLSIQSMLIRVGLAVFFAMTAVAVVSSVVDSYRLQNTMRRKREEAASLQRRMDDEATSQS